MAKRPSKKEGGFSIAEDPEIQAEVTRIRGKKRERKADREAFISSLKEDEVLTLENSTKLSRSMLYDILRVNVANNNKGCIIWNIMLSIKFKKRIPVETPHILLVSNNGMMVWMPRKNGTYHLL